ncbi:MFS transporter [Tessaracoccus caeni]|uniref:MFS transporter n=1 Tax=Tessaracoccus caeni TaxID=3031239 RepID=UPI0023DB11ED|nr:MFS transporter [Tessaracoccus caeni]MDF1487302.1 MFS transporter [Tessaracoccus caeni]
MLTARYSAIQSSYWAAFCLVISFANVFLLARGMTTSQIGVLMAVAGTMATVLQPIVAGMADRSKAPLRLWVALGGVVLAGLAVAVLPLGRGMLLAIVYGLMLTSIQIIQPLTNSLGMAAIDRGFRVNFGLARAFGSFVFAIVSLAAGAIVDATSVDALPIMMLVFLAIFVGLSATFVLRTGPVSTNDDGTAITEIPDNPPLDRRRRRLLVLLIIGLTLAMTSHGLINNFMFQIVDHHGGTAASMGIALTIAAVAELPAMSLWDKIMTRWSAGTMLVFAGIVFAVKNLAMLLAPSLTVIYLTQILQFGCFAIAVPGTVYYVNRLLPRALQVRGQSYMTMTISAGSVLGALVGGWLIDYTGVPTMLLAGTIVATAGAALIWMSAERR